MTPDALAKKVWFGYGKAASKLGVNHALYRPLTALDAITQANAISFSLPASFSVDPAYAKPDKYGNAQWLALVDGNQVLRGDYIVGPSTWFIAQIDPLLPIKVIQCNRVISIKRPFVESAAGAGPYGGSTLGTETALITNWPCSILNGSRGATSEVRLPGDVTMPRWVVLLPALAGLVIRTDDVIEDDLGRRGIIASAELTSFGWRFDALERTT